MKVFREKDRKQAGLVSALIFCFAMFILSSPLEARSNKAPTSSPTKHTTVDSNIDPLQQMSY